jgi:hypothetical protein
MPSTSTVDLNFFIPARRGGPADRWHLPGHLHTPSHLSATSDIFLTPEKEMQILSEPCSANSFTAKTFGQPQKFNTEVCNNQAMLYLLTNTVILRILSRSRA